MSRTVGHVARLADGLGGDLTISNVAPNATSVRICFPRPVQAARAL